MTSSSRISSFSSSSEPRSRRRRRPLVSIPFVVTAALVVSSSVNAFTAVQQRSTVATSLFFRSEPEDQFTSSLFATKNELPIWLEQMSADDAHSNLRLLHKALRNSYFTDSESLKVQTAIQIASRGDLRKVAGAAAFLLVLVDCMEMGPQALEAAAIHYCDCVRARQDQCAVTASAASSPHVQGIVEDAAHLKSLEVVFAHLMKSNGGRVSPDERDAENLRKLLLSETKDWRALAIRTAACLFRLKGLLQEKSLNREAVRMGREALHIYAPLASRLGMHRLKNELEGTAFRLLYPRQYKRVTQLSHEKVSSHGDIESNMREVLEQVQTEMTNIFQRDPEFNKLVERFTVTARVKEPYSMWKKMLRHGYKHILQCPDALAARIVLDARRLSDNEPVEVTKARERALCYYAQKICTEHWKPVKPDARFKDYIDRPKANGYQSLHYTAEVARPDDSTWTMEVQVRSGDMHKVAEFGLASHWDYKAKQNGRNLDFVDISSDVDHSSDAYLRNVQQWHWQQHGGATQPDLDVSSISFDLSARIRTQRIRARAQRLEPYLQALTAAQSDLSRDFVFLFLQQETTANVLALPAGSCVLDAIRASDCPNHRSLSLNGRQVSITKQLQNGDVLTCAP